MKSEIPTRNLDMKSDCFILIRAHQNFVSQRPLPRSDCTALVLWQLASLSMLMSCSIHECVHLGWYPLHIPFGHILLLEKLGELDLAVFALRWLANYLLDRSQFVVVGGESSSSAKVLSGVPQGSVLGPSLALQTTSACMWKLVVLGTLISSRQTWMQCFPPYVAN